MAKNVTQVSGSLNQLNPLLTYSDWEQFETQLSSSPLSAEPEETRKAKKKFRRQRKTPEQLEILNQEFWEYPNWNKEKVFVLAQMTGLSCSQIYKWRWDTRKKISQEIKGDLSQFISTEVLLPVQSEFKIWKVSQRYRKLMSEQANLQRVGLSLFQQACK